MTDYRAFNDTYGPLASEISHETGMDQSVVLGLIGQESGWGAHVNHNNNIFGIAPGGKANSYDSVSSAAQDFVRVIKDKYPDVGQFTPRAQPAYLVSKGYNSDDPTYEQSVWHNAGTVRSFQAQKPSDMPDYTSMYGDPRSGDFYGKNITTITTPGGAKFNVNRSAAEAFRGFTSELEGQGYKIGEGSGGYNVRPITGGTTLSAHSYGTAIDINPSTNPYSKDANGGTLQTDLPSNVGEIAAKYGLTWGGSWGDRKDPMHFEYRGAPTTMYAAGKPSTMTDATSTPSPKDAAHRMIDDDAATYAPPAKAQPAQSQQPSQPATDTTDTNSRAKAYEMINDDEATYAPPDKPPEYHRSFTQDATDFGAGAWEGVKRVAHPLAYGASWLLGPGGVTDRNLGVHVPGSVGTDTLNQQDAAARAQYEKDHNSGFGTAGVIAGETAATLPVLAAAGPALAVGGRTVEAVAPVAKPLITKLGTIGDFVGGQSGGAGSLGSRAVEAASRTTQGAALGGTTAALSGNDQGGATWGDVGTGAAVGAGAGFAAPYLAEGASRVLGGTSSMSPAVADFMTNARDKFGINLRATQVPGALPTSAQTVGHVAGGVAFSGAGRETAPVIKQWDNAVANSAGITDRAGLFEPAGKPLPVTPTNLAEASRNTRTEMNMTESVGAHPSVVALSLNPLAKTVSTIGGPDAPVLAKQFQSLIDKSQQGASFRDLLDDVESSMKASGSATVRKVLGETRDALQDGLQKQLDRVKMPPVTISSGHSFTVDGQFYHNLRGQEYNQSLIKSAMGGSPSLDPASLAKTVNAAPLHNAELPDGLQKQMLASPLKGGWFNPQNVIVPGMELSELAPIGSTIGKPQGTLDKFLKISRMGEIPFAAAAVHGLMGAGLAHLPLTVAGQAAATAGAYGTNSMLRSKWLTNRLISNAGNGVAPWINQTNRFVVPLAANNALMAARPEDHNP